MKKIWIYEGVEYDDVRKYHEAIDAARYLTQPPIKEDTFHGKTRTHTHKCPMCKSPVINMKNSSTLKGFQDNWRCDSDKCDWSHLSGWYNVK